MRAFQVPAPGKGPELADLPAPEPGEGQVLVRVKAAGLNAIDNWIVAGQMAETMRHVYPLVLGRDAAGVVEAVGPGDGQVGVGDEVIGHVLLGSPIHDGTLAEYAVLPTEAVARKPEGLDFVTAAALPLAGAAAKAAVDAVDPRAGHRVLVVGASGGVGSYVIQMLAAMGVTVMATGRESETERLTELGAARIIDYGAAPIADQIREAYPEGIDGLIDVLAYTPQELPLAAVGEGGHVVSLLGAADEQALAAVGLTGTNIIARPTRDVLTMLADQVVAGGLKVDVETVLPLDRAADAFSILASGRARGKIVVQVNP
ncbi:NADP-dependent oxidoreductase [Phytohabitans kaempferiae]|uniref:NADP-dependent oxidoreductase n=1 Tax=Phytohabitans kaempferiae TaxID=1620943 RepID=A0ABV6MAZ0_9ACTN